MVHIVETKYLRGVTGHLVITQTSCVIQRIKYDETVLQEGVIPIVYRSPDIQEISMELNPDIINNHSVIKIDSYHIHTPTVSYPYKQGEMVSWETTLPPLVTIFSVPDITIHSSTRCELVVDSTHLHINLEESVVYHIPTIHTFRAMSGVYLNSGIMGDIFNDHSGELCKLYMEKDAPVCLEFTSMFDLKTRYYIAPCTQDSA